MEKLDLFKEAILLNSMSHPNLIQVQLNCLKYVFIIAIIG